MNRWEFIVIIAVLLFVAFALGWIAHRIASKLSQVTKADLNEMEALAAALHDAEEARDQAVSFLHHREAELKSQIAQVQAELKTAMEGLRDARDAANNLRNS
jgi:hypothetical protein